MPNVVRPEKVETVEKLTKYIDELYKKNQYEEIILAIGMHSLLIDMQNTLTDQASRYRYVLGLIKDRIRNRMGQTYAAWYRNFPMLMDGLVSANRLVIDKSCADVLGSYRAAFGPFKSLEDFYSWALVTDRRLTLDKIVRYIEKTVELQGGH
jgi:hypothetical protein